MRAAQPSLRHIILTAFLGGFLHCLLGLLFRPDKQDFVPLPNRCRHEITRSFELIQRFAQVNDMDAIASVEDEGLHLGIPTFRLVTKMNA
jgi:hypothetical protein